MPFFSVIIPLYNKENYIQEALKSVLIQDFQDFEIVIVNDCSTDNSLEKANEIISEKIRYVNHEQNKGLSASRNTGIRNAKAQYVAFLDADDIWKPQFLQKIKALIDAFPEESLFATTYFEIYPDNLVLPPSVKSDDLKKEEMYLITDYFARSNSQPLYIPSSLCANKNIFENVGFYDEEITFSEDVDFNIRANSYSNLAFYNASEVGYTIFSENQITTSGIKGKKIPDLKYTTLEKENPALKKYIDFERYVLAKQCKLADRKVEFKSFVNSIDYKNLTFFQRILLKMPKSILLMIKKTKIFLLLKGWKITSY
ncbi:glycosyltransferase involved in cell wall biosynthesis [Flavobacterium arsenatis]|uniref:Glycosyltransferase involved in cell wall biosynthesis n=1 Tax=Flavobacterium arsenatis TaxID=1484332 RepID=A0ABU1TNZ2_9FLAO|nr:glycosyltransferase family 2 protein [Flavobacterium arsenatis]MDR6967674.1 glycosyltransferase involved in cell wall biosynthesis [Flavobacterium arsenatis]